MNKAKSRVKFITDSGCDISKENEALYKIDIMPFNILIDEQDYWERIDFTPQEFYDLANNSATIPKTSQITVLRFEEKFTQCYEEGFEDVIVVLINSGGSQTYANALIAKENLEGKIGKMKLHIIDSHAYSLAYGYPLIEAVKKINAGQTVSSVVAFLTDWFNCCEIYIVGFDLRHMKKSGRISAASAFLGELMGLKPVISLIDDVSAVVKKSRGEKQAIEDIANHCFSRAVPETPWLFLGTTCKELEDTFIKNYTKMTGLPPAMTGFSGGVVTSNAGTKFFGVIVRGKPRR